MKFKSQKSKVKSLAGMSLIEILVVITIFAVLGIVVTQSVVLSLRGSKKSEDLIRVRENLDFATGIIDRKIRNANSIPECPNPNPLVLRYIDQNGTSTQFSCSVGSGGYIASGSGAIRLTAFGVYIMDCSFRCTPGASGNPPYVDVNLTAVSSNVSGAEGASVTTSTRVYLRNY